MEEKELNEKKIVGIYRGTRKADGKPFVALHLVGPASFTGFEGEKTEILYIDSDKLPSGLVPGVKVLLDYDIFGNKAYLNGLTIVK